MFKVLYKEKSLFALKCFVDSYKNSFIKLINDSGLEVEDDIIKNYIHIGNNLYKNIIDKVDNLLSTNIILGRNITNNFIALKHNNFRIFVYYSEDITLKSRYVEDIEFYKK
ncbi:MAG: hypothetical protein Q8K30_02435 [Candidatus Gracilibacteria bacterium]|nr:hypothetical protein [Candidatus Gracilibacteria bacterium]